MVISLNVEASQTNLAPTQKTRLQTAGLLTITVFTPARSSSLPVLPVSTSPICHSHLIYFSALSWVYLQPADIIIFSLFLYFSVLMSDFMTVTKQELFSTFEFLRRTARGQRNRLRAKLHSSMFNVFRKPKRKHSNVSVIQSNICDWSFHHSLAAKSNSKPSGYILVRCL